MVSKLKRLNADDPFLKRDHARLAPEIVSAAQYHKFDEFQTGILIYELLHRRNPFEATLGKCDYRCDELPPIPAASIYSPGLQRLAHLLLEPDPGRRIHVQDARRILQVVFISSAIFSFSLRALSCGIISENVKIGPN